MSLSWNVRGLAEALQGSLLYWNHGMMDYWIDGILQLQNFPSF